MSERPSARQLPLDLTHRAAMTRADYLTGDANRAAIALIDGWPAWPDRAVLLSGPAGSGKTHLVEIWRHAAVPLSPPPTHSAMSRRWPPRRRSRWRTCTPARSTKPACST